MRKELSTAEPDSNKKDFNHLLQSGIVDGVVSVIFSASSFTYLDGAVGLVQSFIVLDELAKHLGSST